LCQPGALPSHLADRRSQVAYASDILYIFVLYLSKICVLLLLLRLGAAQRYVRALQGLLGVCCVWCFISIMIIALKCDLGQPWIYYNTQCSHLVSFWDTSADFEPH
jgi:hypothetical protein